MPPLVAVTHSRLGKLEEMREGLRACAALLLQAGADPNGHIYNRFPPASLDKPDENGPLSALYGAAGVIRDPALTALLLDAGADPNDGESLYHSLENPDCTRLLLTRGARIASTNALGRALDIPAPAALELLLANGGDPNEPTCGLIGRSWGSLLLRAIGIRCSSRHVGRPARVRGRFQGLHSGRRERLPARDADRADGCRGHVAESRSSGGSDGG